MAEKKEHQVFISYASQDSEWVHVAVRLLEAGGADVFLDVEHIAYGARWKEVLEKAIGRCQRVLVFWSAAAAGSDWVEKEWTLALALQKRVVPLQLDDTPLPQALAALHGLPLMSLLIDGRALGPDRMVSSLSSRKSPVTAFVAVTAAAVTFSALVFGLKLHANEFLPSLWPEIFVAGLILAGGFGLIAWWRRRQAKHLGEMMDRYVSPEIMEGLPKTVETPSRKARKLGHTLVKVLFDEQ